MRPIVDARAYHGLDTPEDMAAYVELDRRASVVIGKPRETRVGDAHAVARINWGRWLADCPAAPCLHPVTAEHAAGAEYVAVGLPFMCQWCWNQDIDGRWREVDFPADKEAIEAAVLQRPSTFKHNGIVYDPRSWGPGESFAQVQADNIAHGDPV